MSRSLEDTLFGTPSPRARTISLLLSVVTACLLILLAAAVGTLLFIGTQQITDTTDIDILGGTLSHGHFVMYVPGEPHMCNIVMPEAEVGPIKKICFKVISDRYWDEA